MKHKTVIGILELETEGRAPTGEVLVTAKIPFLLNRELVVTPTIARQLAAQLLHASDVAERRAPGATA